jgi:hypothetical protein
MYLSIWKLKKTRHEMKPSKDLRMEVSDNKVRDEGLVFESKKVAFFVGAVFWVFFFVAKELILFYCHTHTTVIYVSALQHLYMMTWHVPLILLFKKNYKILTQIFKQHVRLNCKK